VRAKMPIRDGARENEQTNNRRQIARPFHPGQPPYNHPRIR